MKLKRNSKLSTANALFIAVGITLVMHFIVVIVHFYGRDAFLPPPPGPGGHGPGPRMHRPPGSGELSYVHFITSIVSMLIYTFTLYWLNYKIMKQKLRPTPKIILVVTATFVVSIFLSVLLSRAQLYVFDYVHFPGKFIRGNLSRDLFLAIIVVFSSQLQYVNNKRNQMALENEILVAENVRTRYLALKNQMDPHFLFNSLNTLNSIIKLDPDKAQEYVQKLSYVLRYTLQNNEVITLDEELKFTRAYCSLMQIRYGDSLKFDFDIDPALGQRLVIPLSVQTLVENAIKHNVVSNKHPLTVSVRSDGENITVANPIQAKKDPEPGERIGLSNLAERYRLQWKYDITIEITEEQFSVTIPLIKNNESTDNRR